MNDELNDTERLIERYFADERSRLRAPAKLWSRIESQMAAGEPRAGFSRRRWPAFAGTLAVAIVLGIGTWFGTDHLGGGSSRSANEVLAAALEASEHPDSVGLYSFHGVIEEQYDVAGPLVPDSADAEEGLTDDPSIVEAVIPEEFVSEEAPVPGVIRMWFERPSRYRIEWGMLGESLVAINDGETILQYDPRDKTYATAAANSPEADDFPTSVNPEAISGSLQDVLAQVEADTKGRATLIGEETMLGRRVYVVEANVPAQHIVEPDGDDEIAGGVIRFWIDKQYFFPLGWSQTYMPGLTYSWKYAEVEFNIELDDSLFDVTPPEGGRQVDPGALADSVGGISTGSQTISGDLGKHVSVSAGFLAPTYFVSGYETRAVGEEGDDEDVIYEVTFLIQRAADNGYISVQERRGREDLPDALKQGDEIDAHGGDAWLDADEDGLLHLAWQDGDLVIYMIARGLSQDEFLRVADSMEVSTGEGDSGVDDEGIPELPEG